MVSFANGHQSGEYMVSWSMLVVKWGLAQIVRKTVDAESALRRVLGGVGRRK